MQLSDAEEEYNSEDSYVSNLDGYDDKINDDVTVEKAFESLWKLILHQFERRGGVNSDHPYHNLIGVCNGFTQDFESYVDDQFSTYLYEHKIKPPRLCQCGVEITNKDHDLCKSCWSKK